MISSLETLCSFKPEFIHVSCSLESVIILPSEIVIANSVSAHALKSVDSILFVVPPVYSQLNRYLT